MNTDNSYLTWEFTKWGSWEIGWELEEVIGCWGGGRTFKNIIDLLCDNENDPRKGKLHC